MKSSAMNEAAIVVGLLLILAHPASAQRQMETLDRGVVAVALDDGGVYVGWRMLGTEPDGYSLAMIPMLHVQALIQMTVNALCTWHL